MEVVDNARRFDFPLVIEMPLYTKNHVDSYLLQDLIDKCNGIKDPHNRGDFYVSVTEIMQLLKNKKYSNLIDSFSRTRDMELIANGNSVYFIHNLIKYYHNLTLLKIKPMKGESTLRLAEDDVDVFSYMFRISYGILDFSKYLTASRLKMLNRLFLEKGLISNKYLLRKSYFNIPADQLLNMFSIYDPNTPQKMDFLNEVSEVLFEIIDPKIEQDNPSILVKTDYSFL
jgi:hypothetical protein